MFKKKCAVAALCLCLAFCLSGCAVLGEVAESLLPSAAPTSLPVVNHDEESPIYLAYTRLSENEQSIYRQLCEHIEAQKTDVTIENADENMVMHAFYAVFADHPEYFWLSGGYSYSAYTFFGKDKVEFQMSTRSVYTDLTGEAQALRAAVDRIAAEAVLCEGDYQKALFVHDAIIKECTYDNQAADVLKEKNGDSNLRAASAHGCLVDHRAVCSGYAAAFQLVMQKLGIVCGRISGCGEDGLGHEWNYIRLGDTYAYVDVTWDDPHEEEELQAPGHEFFCVSEEELLKSHTIDPEEWRPPVTTDQYEYYRVHGWYFDTYEASSVRQSLREQADAGFMTVKFGSLAEAKRAKEDLIDAERIFWIVPWQSLGYTAGASELILTVWKQE